jgi:hypothetical protein
MLQRDVQTVADSINFKIHGREGKQSMVVGSSVRENEAISRLLEKLQRKRASGRYGKKLIPTLTI